MMRSVLLLPWLCVCPAAQAALHAAVGIDGRLYIADRPLRGGVPFEPAVGRHGEGLQPPMRVAVQVPAFIGRLVEQAGRKSGIDADLLHAVIRVESNYDSRAMSAAGAAGLMQLTAATSRRFGVRDRFDPGQNLHGGAAYLAWLLKRFEGNLELALAAYNAGERAVERNGNRMPPFAETQNFVNKVLSHYAH